MTLEICYKGILYDQHIQQDDDDNESQWILLQKLSFVVTTLHVLLLLTDNKHYSLSHTQDTMCVEFYH